VEHQLLQERLWALPDLILAPDTSVGKYDLNKASIVAYLRTLKGQVFHNATIPLSHGKPLNIGMSNRTIKEITQFGMSNPDYMKSLAYIPEFAEMALCLKKEGGTKDRYNEYYHLVTGADIGGKKYVVRVVVGELNGGWYYNHFLTKISKNDLLASILLAKQGYQEGILEQVKEGLLAGIPLPKQGYQEGFLEEHVKDSTLLKIVQEVFAEK
jgi:hypothetical protein